MHVVLCRLAGFSERNPTLRGYEDRQLAFAFWASYHSVVRFSGDVIPLGFSLLANIAR